MRELNANKGQLQAIFHQKGPARVIAGPGSGKTFTIIQRIIYLIVEHHVPPGQILTITFTKSAAIEMRDRYLENTIPHSSSSSIDHLPHFGTLHSLGYQILKDSGFVRGYSLISETKKRNLIEQLLKNEGYSSLCDFDTLQMILTMISKYKNGLKSEEFELPISQMDFEKIYLQYQDFMKEQRLLDFDDMISLCVDQLRKNKKLLTRWQEAYSYIQVDEFQDVNEIQYEMIRLLSNTHQNLFVVGDDDQAIYGFRGSSPSIMQQFLMDYPKAKQLSLIENFRCREEIVLLAQKVIDQNLIRVSKKILAKKQGGSIFYYQAKNKQDEMEKLVNDISILSVEEQMNSAIILRTNREVDLYQSYLKDRHILLMKPMKSDDLMMHSIAEDFKSFLLFIYQGNSRKHIIRFINKPQRFISSKVFVHEKVLEEDLLAYYKNNKEMCDRIHKLFRGLERAGSMSPVLAIRYFRKVLGYDHYLLEKQDANQLLKKADQIQELLKEVRKGESIEAFWERKEKDNVRKESVKHDMGVSVMTMHAFLL